MQACGREPRREQVPPAQAPQHRPSEPARQTGGEENRQSALLARGPGLQDLVDRATRETPPGQVIVEGRDPEGKGLRRPPLRSLQPGDPRP